MKTCQSQDKKRKELNASKSSTGLSCLITGFDPFSEHLANPSASVALLMPKKLTVKGVIVPVTSLILPTQGAKAWQLLKEAVAQMPNQDKRVIILLGLASGRKTINIERFALNILDYQAKDNDGNIFTGKEIERGAPQAVKTKSPIEEVLVKLNKEGLPAAISNFCGTFVCNETYFRALNDLQKPSSRVSFVHLPLPRAYGLTLRKRGGKYSHLANNKENQLIAMSKAIKIMAQFYCEEMVK